MSTESKILGIIGVISTIITGITYYFLVLPSLAISSLSFWSFLFFTFLFSTIIVAAINYLIFDEDIYAPTVALAIITALILVILAIGGFAGSKMTNAKKASDQLTVVEVSKFEEIVSSKTLEEVEDTFPKIDEASAKIIANRKLGELVDLVSQFEVDRYCTLINYQGQPHRVSPLAYSSFLKYEKNKENGIPGYILINLVTKESCYVSLEEGINYSPSAYFSKDLERRIKKDYPGAILGEFNFEIDENGVPYWIVPDIKVTKGIGGLKTTQGAFIINAQSGEIKRYSVEEIPSWVDRAFDTDIIRKQINNWGELSNGFFNSIFTQNGVKTSTDLYNFIVENDDVYLYTGITSAKSEDKSNIGFMTVNMRTGQSKFITLASADETSAKESAQGKVQEKGYVATDPILLNLNSIPTYALSLKDEGGLVKMYAFVSVEDFQKVGVAEESEGISEALNNYMKYFNKQDIEAISPDLFTDTVITVEQIEKAEINGNSTYYIVSENNIYVADIFSGGDTYKEGSPYFSCLPTIKVGDTVSITYIQKEGYREVSKISK